MSERYIPVPADHHVYIGDDGVPKRCDHCEYYPSASRCNNRYIIELAKQGRYGLSMASANLAKVAPAGCSDYFEPK